MCEKSDKNSQTFKPSTIHTTSCDLPTEPRGFFFPRKLLDHVDINLASNWELILGDRESWGNKLNNRGPGRSHHISDRNTLTKGLQSAEHIQSNSLLLCEFGAPLQHVELYLVLANWNLPSAVHSNHGSSFGQFERGYEQSIDNGQKYLRLDLGRSRTRRNDDKTCGPKSEDLSKDPFFSQLIMLQLRF